MRSQYLVVVDGYEDCHQTANDAQYPDNRRIQKLTLATDYQLVSRSQAKLVERQSTGDRLARVLGRAILLVPSLDDRLFEISGDRRAAGAHYCVRDKNVGGKSEVTGPGDFAEYAESQERRHHDLFRFHVLENFGGNVFLEL